MQGWRDLLSGSGFFTAKKPAEGDAPATPGHPPRPRREAASSSLPPSAPPRPSRGVVPARFRNAAPTPAPASPPAAPKARVEPRRTAAPGAEAPRIVSPFASSAGPRVEPDLSRARDPGQQPERPSFPPGPRKRLVIIDLGEVRTSASGFDVTDADIEPVLVGRTEIESAVLPGEVPARVGAQRGMRIASAERVEAPPVIRPAAAPEDHREQGLLLAGRPAATLGGTKALLANDPNPDRVAALLTAVVFPMIRDGDSVEIECTDGPNAAQDAIVEVVDRWDGETLTFTGLDRQSGELESRTVHVRARATPIGDAYLELAYESELILEGGAPVVVLDVGHRNSRLLLLDFQSGLLDLEILPHGGDSFLAFARRYAEERGWQAGSYIELLRQLEAGVEMLTFGGMSFVTRTFFTCPREELVKAIASSVARRLRAHVEGCGRWPAALLLTGGPAPTLAGDVGRRLTELGMPIEKVEVLARRGSLQLGAKFAWLRR